MDVIEFGRAMVRVKSLVLQGLRLAFDNPDLSERHLLDADAIASEFGFHSSLRRALAEEAAYEYRLELACRS